MNPDAVSRGRLINRLELAAVRADFEAKSRGRSGDYQGAWRSHIIAMSARELQRVVTDIEPIADPIIVSDSVTTDASGIFDMPSFEYELWGNEEFKAGVKAGQLLQTAMFMREDVLQETALCARTFMPTSMVGVVMRIKDITGVFIHSQDFDENAMVVCIHRPGTDFMPDE